METLYHATPYENLGSILKDGQINPGCDGIVYLTKTPRDAAKFMLVHLVQHFIVIEVNVEDDWVFETFDHNEAFFKCRCFGVDIPIPEENFTNFYEYNLKK